MATAQTKRMAGAAGAATVIAALVAGGVWLTGRAGKSGDDLMARATLTVPASYMQTRGVSNSHHAWRSDHEVLHLDQSGAMVALDVTRPGSPVRRAVAAPPLPGSRVNPISFSPDSKWLLCEDRGATPAPGGPPPRHYFVVALDGSGRRRDWPILSYGGAGVVWLSDSRRFMTVLFDATKSVYVARVFSVDAPGISKPRRLYAMGRGGNQIVGALPGGRFLRGAPSIAFAGRGAGTTASRESFTEFGVEPGAAPSRVVTIAAPPVGSTYGAGGATTILSNRYLRVSPRGDCVLWVVSTFDFSPPLGYGTAVGKRLYPFLSRVLPPALQPRQNVRYRYDLATARLDGRGGITRLGSVSPPIRQNAAGFVMYGFIGDWEWTPDGKRISFTCDGALYTVPVDGP